MREIEYGAAARLIEAVGGPAPGSMKGRHFGLLFVAFADRKAGLGQASGSIAFTRLFFGRNAMVKEFEDAEEMSANRHDNLHHPRCAGCGHAWGIHTRGWGAFPPEECRCYGYCGCEGYVAP